MSSRNHAQFESGNQGNVIQEGPYQFRIELRSDNDDALPDFWRRWWFIQIDNLPTDRPVTLTITGAGQWAYYLPLFTYGPADAGEESWEHFPQTAVDQPERLGLRIRYRFKHSKVFIARFMPYTLSRLKGYLKGIADHPDVKLNIAGFSVEARPMPVVTITKKGSAAPRRVFIHARTHPGEVGSSFLLEGFIEQLLAKDRDMERLRSMATFDILPVLNIDGVYRGNNRVTPGGINLEGKWYPAKAPTSGGAGHFGELDPYRTPQEVLVWFRWIQKSLQNTHPSSVPVMALNLHSSSVQPGEGLFSFPHFGPVEMGYEPGAAELFRKQISFMSWFQKSGGSKWFLPLPTTGTKEFVAKNLPETWWWQNFGPAVMALTLEATYGRAPGGERWVRPEDLRRLGGAMAKGILRYLDDEHGGLTQNRGVSHQPTYQAH